MTALTAFRRYRAFGACEIDVTAPPGSRIYTEVGPRLSYMIAGAIGGAASSASGTAAATALESKSKHCRGPYKPELVAEADALHRLADLTWSEDQGHTMFPILRLAGCLAVLLLCACAASGPTFDEAGFGSESIPAGKARIVFLRTRDSGLYIARQASISLDGEKIGGTAYGSFFVQVIDAGKHGLRADMWDMPGQCELMITAAAGETYYFQVDPRSESFGAFAAGDLATQFLTMNVLVNVAGGVSAVAAESYGKECGGAFRIYPLDTGTAITRLGPLRRAE